MYQQLQEINRRPAPFERYTARDLWTDEHTSSKMLAFHLDGSVDVASRNTAFIDQSSRWIVSRFDLDNSKAVIDVGCGPGLYTTRLAASGAAVTGLDFSERSIWHARQSSRQRQRIEYIHTNYLDYETTSRFDLITMIMCDFCALSPEQRRAMIEKFSSWLKPEGAVLLDVYSLVAFREKTEAVTYAPGLLDDFWSPEPYFGFLNTFKYEVEKVVLDKYSIVEQERTRVIYNWLQYFDREALEQEFESAGLVVEEFLGDVAGAPYDPNGHEFAVIARGSTQSS